MSCLPFDDAGALKNILIGPRPLCFHFPLIDLSRYILVCKIYASGDFCRLLTHATFTNGLNPYQDRQYVGPDQDPDRSTLIGYLKEFFEKVNLEKSQQTTKKKNENLFSKTVVYQILYFPNKEYKLLKACYKMKEEKEMSGARLTVSK